MVSSVPSLSRRAFMVGLASAGAAVLAGCGSEASESSSTSSSNTDSSSAAESSSTSRTTTADGTVTADEDVQTLSTFLFDTVIQIQAACDADLLDQVNDRMIYFENKFSRTVEGSDIWNINNAGGEPVEVAEETADLISKALEFCEESGGLFDITIGAVSSLWDFVEGVKPEDSTIAEAVTHVDYQGVSVDGTTVTLSDPAAMLDLGGIAKGYITDDIVSMLREGGCKDAFINLGGNVYVIGNSFDGDEWVVGVQDPNGSLNEGIAKLVCSDVSVVTSGLYERCFDLDGVTYYHILDPRTGYPVETDLASASIACESSTTADAYSTILFLEGHDAALQILETDERFLGGVLVDDDENVTVSDGSDFELL